MTHFKQTQRALYRCIKQLKWFDPINMQLIKVRSLFLIKLAVMEFFIWLFSIAEKTLKALVLSQPAIQQLAAVTNDARIQMA